MKKVYYTNSDIKGKVLDILRQMQQDNWKPDYVVGITRGGLVPANMISQYLGCPMESLKVSISEDKCESNLWMAEDAFGYDMDKPKNILIVDDINDSGATLSWIKQDWASGCLPKDDTWSNIWGNNVRVAVLYDNASSTSTLDVNYAAECINKYEDPQWIVFPWEEWWRRWNPQEEHQ